MRKIPGLDQLLDRVAARDAQPTYRFHGRRSPKERDRTPVLGQVSTNVKDGVAKMRLYDPIDSWGGVWGVSATEFADAVDELGDDVTEIRLHINSPGGEVWEALAILNTLRAHDARLVCVVDGLAASCASFIAAAGDETIMSPNTQLMIHDAWALSIGNEATMLEAANLLGRVSNNIASIYADKAGGTVESWRSTMKDEAWYSAEEAVDVGLADKVAGEEPEEDPVDAFDLSAFKHQGRADAPDPTAKASATSTDAEDESAPVPDARRAEHRARRHAQAAARHGLTA
jgi:ATP-dependent Clp endopeptidase proteolytic subunit ClpP